MFIVFGRDISLVLRTREISLHKNNSHDLHRVITHSLVLVIILAILMSMRQTIIYLWGKGLRVRPLDLCGEGTYRARPLDLCGGGTYRARPLDLCGGKDL